MTNLLRTGLEYLAEELKAHASETVTYRRGALTVSALAVCGRTEYKSQDESGNILDAEIIDFIFVSADLILSGTLVTPLPGDEIVTDRATFEVMYLGGEGCWKFSDPFGKAIRIHTKKTSI
jgi:hypothetical protein